MLSQRNLRRALRAAQVGASSAARSAPFDPLELCHDGQRAAVADGSGTQAWVTTRRAGKTTGAVFKLLRTALAAPDVNCLYLNTTIKRAVGTVWDELLRANRDHRLGGVANHTRHFLRLPNGSKVHVSGCETRAEADAWRGVLPRTALVFVDEGQDWKPELLEYTYGSVVAPSLADIGGQFVLAGTPGAPRGFFYDFHVASPCHTWSLFANPHVKNARQMLDEAMRVRGCDETDPSIRREFFAEFCADQARQIFPFDDAKNGVNRTELPTGLQHVVGGDYGTVDALGLVVWGYRDDMPHLFVVETVKLAGLGSSAQVEQTRTVAARYGNCPVVGDPGGGGKGLIVDLRQEHGLPVQGAEKQGKAAACITLRDGLRSGRVKVVREEREFIDELQRPEWDPERVGEVIKGHMPDRVDAALYGYRLAAKLHRYAPPAPAKTRQQVELEQLAAHQARQTAVLRRFGLS